MSKKRSGLTEKQLEDRPVRKAPFSSPTRRSRTNCKADRKEGFWIKRSIKSWPVASQSVRRALMIHERTCPECGHGIRARSIARKGHKGTIVVYTCESKSCGYHSRSPLDLRVTV